MPAQPELTAGLITPKQLHELVQDATKIAGKDYLVVDVRRTDVDEAPGDIVHPSAINLPAQTFYQTLPVIYEVLHRCEPSYPLHARQLESRYPRLSRLIHSTPLVIFHCNSCRGRGPRCAGWYADELARRGCTSSKALTLEGGLNAWREAYPELVKPVDNS